MNRGSTVELELKTVPPAMTREGENSGQHDFQKLKAIQSESSKSKMEKMILGLMERNVKQATVEVKAIVLKTKYVLMGGLDCHN